MLVTKDIRNKLFDYIDPWGKNLISKAWVISLSHYCTLKYTPVQAIFFIYMVSYTT